MGIQEFKNKNTRTQEHKNTRNSGIQKEYTYKGKHARLFPKSFNIGMPIIE